MQLENKNKTKVTLPKEIEEIILSYAQSYNHNKVLRSVQMLMHGDGYKIVLDPQYKPRMVYELTYFGLDRETRNRNNNRWITIRKNIIHTLKWINYIEKKEINPEPPRKLPDAPHKNYGQNKF